MLAAGEQRGRWVPGGNARGFFMGQKARPHVDGRQDRAHMPHLQPHAERGLPPPGGCMAGQQPSARPRHACCPSLSPRPAGLAPQSVFTGSPHACMHASPPWRTAPAPALPGILPCWRLRRGHDVQADVRERAGLRRLGPPTCPVHVGPVCGAPDQCLRAGEASAPTAIRMPQAGTVRWQAARNLART